MPQSSRNKNKYAQEMLPSSQKLDAIDNCLQKMLDAFPQKGRLTPEEVQDWHRDLTPFSLQAIEFAFDSHRRNAIFFPLYGQILDLCISFDGTNIPKNTTNCDAICKARHGKGYSEVDIKYLWEIYTEKRESLPNRPMTDLEIDSLLNDLDRKRGHKPVWRQEIA